MPRLQVERSIKINAPAEVVYSALNDFSKWLEWSPWLIMDPDAKVTIAEDGKSYEWDGERVGSGEMKIRDERENEFIQFDLNFIKPWKSVSSTSFHLQSVDGGTEATWTMDSTLPFFMFWMKKMMKAYVGADYDRGLNMLKALVEQGEIHSKLEFEGLTEIPDQQWIGIKTACDLDIISTSMEADFAMLNAVSETDEELSTGPFFTIYHKWDIVRNRATYVAAMPVSNVPDNLPDNFISGVIPGSKAYKLRHVGALKHLGNAWSTLYSMHRNKEMKPKKGTYPFEVYVNDPQKIPEKELITEIHFPVK
ncbi:SRPBCC family protein [Ekhidna sp.]|uniref:SRPBCC family protein n=1 Tax=Ekhidna sp. TaxID=2608089 RepID=UPI003CCC1A4E